VKLLVVAALLMTVPSAPQKKDKALIGDFDHEYMAQVEKANAALRDYTNTPCVSVEFPAAEEKLAEAATRLNGMYHSIPETEDEIVQARQVELAIGFSNLLSAAAEAQNQCLDDYKNRKTSKVGGHEGI